MKYQQGDVIVRAVKEIPSNAVEVKARDRGYVLAEGETSGHYHVLDAIPTTRMFSDGGTMFLSLLAPQKIRHEEHKEIELPAGNYKVGIVKEVDPFSEEVRSVRD